MTEDRRSPLQSIKDWWSVVVIAVAILGGYWWLERNFARIEKLDAEKCSLSYEIRITRGDIEFKSNDEELDLHRSELEHLLQLADRPQERVEFKKGFIESLEERGREISDRLSCLRRAKDDCFHGDVDTGKCYD